jgi:hypothetical protein
MTTHPHTRSFATPTPSPQRRRRRLQLGPTVTATASLLLLAAASCSSDDQTSRTLDPASVVDTATSVAAADAAGIELRDVVFDVRRDPG